MMRRAAAAAMALASTATAPALAQAPDTAAQALKGAAFLDRETFEPGHGVVRWRSNEVRLGPASTLRIQVGETLRGPLRPDADLFDAGDLDVTLLRSWPRAVSFAEGGLEFDVSPHAGLGVGSRGGSAEAGAMLTVGQRRERQAVEALKDFGVRDGLEYGDRGRWYLFAAASGRAVGLNMLRNEGDWDRAGWSTDTTGALVGDAQVGVGWRKGDMQSSFGVIHREVRGEHMVFGQHTRDDTVAAFTFSIRPQR